MLRLLLGRAGSGKTGQIINEIKTHIANGENGLIMVVPEQYSHDAERMLCKCCGDSSSLYAEVLSFSRICTRVFSELGGISDKFIDEAGKVLVMSRALDIAVPQLKIYNTVAHRSEFISRLIETAKEFRSSVITVQDILNTANNVSSSLKDKLNDIAIILDIYWSLLDIEVKDPDEKLDRLAKLLPQSKLTARGHFWIDGFTDFTVQQLNVIKALLEKDCDITVCLTCDSLYSDNYIFNTTHKTAAKLISLAQECQTDFKAESMPESMLSRPKEMRYLEANLFESGASVYDSSCEAITAYICKDITEECEFAASQAIKLVKNGARWQDIAIAVGEYSSYAGMCESIFESYRVPVYQNIKIDVLKMPPILAVSSALRILTSGWDYESMFTYFKTGFAGIATDECDVLENYVLLWNIRGSVWYKDEPWTLSQDGYNAPAEEKALEDINIIRNKCTLPLIKLQRNMKNAETNADRLNTVFEFINDIALFENIEHCAEQFENADDRLMAEYYLRIGSVLTEAMEQFFSVAGSCASSLEDFIYQWELLLSKYDIGSIPTSADSVTFGEISRLKKRGIKHLIILGMTEDNVPHISQSSGVFSDAERDELLQAELSLSQSSEERLYGDIVSIYDAVTMPSETLTLSYPEKGISGESKNPSYIFEAVYKLMNIEIKRTSPAEYKTTAYRPCLQFAGIYHMNDKTAAAAAAVLKNDDNFKHFLYIIQETAGLKKKRISPYHAKQLYGDKMTMTASRVDKYQSCRFSYFLQYGLRARPRIPAEFDASVIGTFLHYILENVTRDIEAAGGFQLTSDIECEAVTRKYVACFVREKLQNMKDKTSRFKYLFDVLTKDTISVVLNMASELRKSEFHPLDFELKFSHSGDLPPFELSDGKNTMSVSGIVDRVDGWVHDDKLYVRVVDYKTGIKTFSLSDVWYGMGMQMLIYLFALENMGKSRYGMDVIPSGVLYAPAREVLLSESRYATDEELEKKRLSSLRRSGIIMDNETVIEAMEHGEKSYIPVKVGKNGNFTGESLVTAEQLGILSKHINKVILEINREIFNGDISADPYFRNQVDNSCIYCDYYYVCHFDENADGKPRKLTKLKTPEIWEKMNKEIHNE